MLIPYVDVLKSCAEVLQGGCDMEVSSAPKCAITAWGYDERVSVCHGVRVDGEWEHPRIPGEEPRCGPDRACALSIHAFTVFVSCSQVVQ
jgi:hypothetical protein